MDAQQEMRDGARLDSDFRATSEPDDLHASAVRGDERLERGEAGFREGLDEVRQNSALSMVVELQTLFMIGPCVPTPAGQTTTNVKTVRLMVRTKI